MRFFTDYIVSSRIIGALSLIPMVLLFVLHGYLAWIYSDRVIIGINKDIHSVFRNISVIEVTFCILILISGYIKQIHKFFTSFWTDVFWTALFFNLAFLLLIILPFNALKPEKCEQMQVKMVDYIKNSTKMPKQLLCMNQTECIDKIPSFISKYCTNPRKSHSYLVSIILFMMINSIIISKHKKFEEKLDNCVYVAPISKRITFKVPYETVAIKKQN